MKRSAPSFAWVLVGTICAISAAPAWACLWYYGKNSKGEEVTVEGLQGHPDWYVKHLRSHEDHEDKALIDTSTEPPGNADFKLRSDYAATLVHQGKSARAAEILESVEKEHPGEYIVAVNLGTAYELSGDNEKALKWIGEGLRRNPESHYGTEWLHVKILEAKIAAAKDPEWIKTHSVLGLDFGSGDVPVLPPSGKGPMQSPEHVLNSLRYQLHERLAFVPPPDPLIAGMLADMGDLLGLLKTADHAVPVYDLALTYRPVNADLVARRRAHAAQYAGEIISLHKKQERQALRWTWIAVIAAGAAIVLAVRKWLRQDPPAPRGSGNA